MFNVMKKSAVVCTSLLVGLFGYTAASKMLQREAFRAVLEQVPHLKTGAATLSVWLPLAELLVVLLLLLPATRLAGLYASLLLLFLFTGYLVYLLATAPHLPCSCGGVIGAMGWRWHVVFNTGFMIVAVVGIRGTGLRDEKRRKSKREREC